jgi:biotin transporter BioY
MALFVDELQQLSQEVKKTKEGKLPPLLTFLTTAVTMFFTFIFSFLYVFPYLKVIFEMQTLIALFISLGVFIISNAVIGEVIAYFVERRREKVLSQKNS